MTQDKATLQAKATELKASLAQQLAEKQDLELAAAKCTGREKANLSRRIKTTAERIKKTKLALANTVSRINNCVTEQTASHGEEQEQRSSSLALAGGKDVDKAVSRDNDRPAEPPGHHHPVSATTLPIRSSDVNVAVRSAIDGHVVQKSSGQLSAPVLQNQSQGMTAAANRKRQASITQENSMRKKMAGEEDSNMEVDQGNSSDTEYKEGEEESDSSDGDSQGDEEGEGDGGPSARQAKHLETPAQKESHSADEDYHRILAHSYVKPHIIKRTAIPAKMRELIRKHPDYLNDVVTMNYDLTLEILMNNRLNYFCIHHITQNRKLNSKEVDNLKGPTRIWGTALQRKQNADKRSRIPREPEHLHCGCHERLALAGLIMFKTWKVKATIDNQVIEEGLQRPLSPRVVLFFLQFLKSNFGYTVEDMFTGARDAEEEAEKHAEVMKKVASFCATKYTQLTGQELLLDKVNDKQASVGEGEWY